MRIGVHDFAGHPFQVELSRALAERGHVVRHWYCASVTTGRGPLGRRATDPEVFSIEPIQLRRGFERHSSLGRFRSEVEYSISACRAITAFEPDVVLSANTPLLAQAALLRAIHKAGAQFVFWQQDVLSLWMTRVAARRYGRAGLAGGELVQRLERRLLANSDEIVVISEDFLPILTDWGIPGHHVTVIENWAPLADLPLIPRLNAWSDEAGLSDSRVVLYSGTLGLKHEAGMIVELARSLADHSDVRVVVVSEGSGADLLMSIARTERLANLVVFPFQPFERLPEVLATGDVLLALLGSSAGPLSVPSKVLSYHCAGRAILASVPADNLAARVIDRAGSGVVVEPGCSAELIDAARRLLEDEDLRSMLGQDARAYAESAFDIERVSDDFEQLLVGSRTPVGVLDKAS